jgi:hypothetical protein
MPGYFGNRSRFFKEMCRSGYDDEFAVGAYLRCGFTIEFQNDVVGAADDQQRRRPHVAQMASSQIGTAAARDDGPDPIRQRRRGNQRRSRARARSEIPRRQVRQSRLCVRPPRRADQAARQQADVESKLTRAAVDGIFPRSQ